jgi:phosphoglycolate phosphatase
MKSKVKLVIWDFDGTIADSVPGIHRTVNLMAKKYKIKMPISKIKVTKSVGAGLDKFLELLFAKEIKKYGLQKIKKDYLKIYRKNYKYGLKLFKGIREVLKKIYKNKILNIIVSNKLRKSVKNSCKYLGINKYIKEIIGRGDLPKDKPHPYPILYLIKKYGLKKNETLFIGDSQYDCEAAKRAKVKFVYLLHGYGDKNEVLKFKPDFILKNAKTLSDIIFAEK